MRKAQVVRPQAEGLVADQRYGPNSLKATYGIENKTVDHPRLTMQRSVMPPGDRNQRHYHINADAGMFIIKGRIKVLLGPDHEIQEDIAEPGDFVFVPAGTIHGLINLSDTEEAVLVATYAGVGSKEESGVVLVEPRWK